MKTLVVFYSRSGTTRKVAKAIVEKLNCDFEEIFDTKDRSGVLGFMTAGRDASFNKLTIIKATKINPSSYDMVIIGTPVWAFTMASPIRTYITENKDRFKKVAFFCTVGGVGSKGAFKNMEEICGKPPVALLELLTKEVVEGNYGPKVKEFLEKIAN